MSLTSYRAAPPRDPKDPLHNASGFAPRKTFLQTIHFLSSPALPLDGDPQFFQLFGFEVELHVRGDDYVISERDAFLLDDLL